MSFDTELQSFFNKEQPSLVIDPLKFKAKLHIGEDAYRFLTIAGNLELMISTGSLGATVASSSFIASSIFGKGLLYSLGLATATTPLGWILGAGVGTAGAAYGLKKVISGKKSEKILSVPKYINTPIDLLALRLTEIMIPIALKISYADRLISQKEIDKIHSYFIDIWGLNSTLVSDMIDKNIQNIDSLRYAELAANITKFTSENKDCNQKEICLDLIHFAEEICHADGEFCEREEIEIDYLRHKLLHGLA